MNPTLISSDFSSSLRESKPGHSLFALSRQWQDLDDRDTDGLLAEVGSRHSIVDRQSISIDPLIESWQEIPALQFVAQ